MSEQLETKASNVNVLPELECLVCSQRGHGVHFGVVTCRACASFFSRSVGQKRAYKCLRGANKCDIKQEGTRKACRACRLQRCQQVGMRMEQALQQQQLDLPPHLNRETFVEQSNIPKYISGEFNRLEIADENAPILAKFLRGLHLMVANQRSAFMFTHPELVFQNITIVEVTKDDIMRIQKEARPFLFTVLNEHVEPFGQMAHEEKMRLFDSAYDEIIHLQRNFLTMLTFPGPEDSRVVHAAGYMTDLSGIDDFIRGNTPMGIDPEEYFRVKKPFMEKLLYSYCRFKRVEGIREQDLSALMLIVLWNEAEQLGMLNEDIAEHKKAIFNEWLENLHNRFGDMPAASKFMARLLCLLVELKATVLKLQETSAMFNIFKPELCSSNN